MEIQRVSARRLELHFQRVEGLLLEKDATELGMASEQRRQRMPDELAGRLAQQRAHARADVADAVFGVDLPQPADTALLIFLEQEARAFALAADVGIGLELVESPASDGQDTEDRYSKSEYDR